MEKILDPILAALTLGIVGVLVAIIKSVGDVTIQYIAKKKEMVEQKLKLDKHEEEFKTAQQVWNIVEEKYRITDNIKDLAKSKADEFDKLLLEKIPYLTEEQVKMLRQALAGEYNKGKAMLNEDSLKQQATQLVEENEKLKLLNAETENKLAAVKSLNESL
ncbi:cobalt ABC transporter permease [Clostridium perfringens]|uniref:Phage-like protein n=1 Tax=Clostridium perfringens TaxID=1502 RepID=A0A2X2XWL5_CLOPF|nr:cobalt ABC transporter permease [Clostridium perfringens]MBI6030929.1 cobalt ABC transporter permease [Clostridium perfringens]MBI6034278.1 cobalt ABC transporter permease [Clostridium perfringens]MBI6069411.1 cobalt ABC transporter permease [Clostridium perfringens]MBI6097579.1 cobalt ABC transporter permease [Clostridium perfringens]UUR88545.1 cobalt ABC transporter permease [Clostridium perfringens]